MLGYCQQSRSLQNHSWYWGQGECIRFLYLGLVGFKVPTFAEVWLGFFVEKIIVFMIFLGGNFGVGPHIPLY
jgi:hypothetical protein